MQAVQSIQYGMDILYQFLIVVGLLVALVYLTWALFWCEVERAVEGFEEELPYDPYLSNLLLQLYLDLQNARTRVGDGSGQQEFPVPLNSIHYEQFKRLGLHLMSGEVDLDRFDRELEPRMQLLLAELMRPLFARDQLKHEFLLERFLKSRREALVRAATTKIA